LAPGRGANCAAAANGLGYFGWTVSGGADYALTNNVILRTEVLFFDLGSPRTAVFAQTPAAGTVASAFSAVFGPAGFIVARAGVSYKF
jgi:outer membrane immunogenic protein